MQFIPSVTNHFKFCPRLITALWFNAVDDILMMFFSYFSHKIGSVVCYYFYPACFNYFGAKFHIAFWRKTTELK